MPDPKRLALDHKKQFILPTSRTAHQVVHGAGRLAQHEHPCEAVILGGAQRVADGGANELADFRGDRENVEVRAGALLPRT